MGAATGLSISPVNAKVLSESPSCLRGAGNIRDLSLAALELLIRDFSETETTLVDINSEVIQHHSAVSIAVQQQC